MKLIPTSASLLFGISCMALFNGESRERNPRLKNRLFLANILSESERHLILPAGRGQLAISCCAFIAGLRADRKRMLIVASCR